MSLGKTAQVHIGHASSRACTLALRRWGPADGHQTPGVMAHVQVMLAQGILHQVVGSCQRPSNTWSDGSSVQDHQIMGQGMALVRRGSCKVTARSSEQAMTRFPQQSPAGVLSIVQTIHAPHTHSSTYNYTGEWLRKQTIRLQVAHNSVQIGRAHV